MKQYRIAFFFTEKQKSRAWADVLYHAAKIHGDVVVTFPKTQLGDGEILKDFDGAAILGMARLGTTIKEACRKYNKHLLYFDKGYTKGIYWRASVDNWQPLEYFQLYKRPSDRFAAWRGWSLREWRKTSTHGHILLAGACQNYTDFMGLGNVTEYNKGVVAKIREHTDRKIIYRPNPSWATKHADEFSPIEGTETSLPPQTFDHVLANCHTVVTHGTSAAVTALAAGIPNMVLGPGIVRPLALTEHDWHRLEEPYQPGEKARRQFFNDLAYQQFTHDEFMKGYAWSEIRRALAVLERLPFSELGLSLIDQYKLMHRTEDYFKGLSTVHYRKQILELIRKTVAKTVLDYGSGKGKQYLQPHALQNDWGVTVTCYDPALPAPIGVLPKGQFEGVICCDVMEHIAEADVPATLKCIFDYATKFVFLAIATVPAKKLLPDGNNCHVTVKPLAWWQNQVDEAHRASGKSLRIVVHEEQQDEPGSGN